MKQPYKLVLTIEADSREGCIALAAGWAEISKAGDPKYKKLVVKGGIKATWDEPTDPRNQCHTCGKKIVGCCRIVDAQDKPHHMECWKE